MLPTFQKTLKPLEIKPFVSKQSVSNHQQRHSFQNPTGVIYVGDSRVNGIGGGNSYGGGVYRSTLNGGYSIIPFFPCAINGKSYLPSNHNYGVGSSTSLCLYYRLPIASNATTGNPAATLTSSPTDGYFNYASSSAYSIIGHPSNCIFMQTGRNDMAVGAPYFTGPLQSMQVIGKTLDRLTHKTVFLSNEHPVGNAIKYFESHSVNGSFQVQATNTSGFADGTTFGIIGCFNGTNGIYYTKVSSLTGTIGEYTVTSGGLYTFNSTDGITTALICYKYNTEATRDFMITLHNWLESDSSRFVDPYTNIEYPVSGALYRRPWVVSVDIWGALEDATNVSSAGYLLDGTHPSWKGALAASKAYAAAWNRIFPSIPRIVRTPITNNMRIASGNGATKTWTVTLPISMANIAHGQLHVYVQGTSVGGYDDGNSPIATITGTGLTGTNTYNRTTRSLTFTTSSAPAPNAVIRADGDLGNCIENGTFDTAILGNGTITPSSSPGVSGTIPKPWTVTAGNLGPTIVVITPIADDGDGYPGIKLEFSPNGGVLATNPSFRILSNISPIVSGQTYQGSMKVKITPGPDGHLYGFPGIGMTMKLTSTTAISRAGATPNSTAFLYVHMGGLAGGDQTWNDDMLENGILEYEVQTPAADTNGFTSPTGEINMALSLTAGLPISATVVISRCSVSPVYICSQEF